MSKRQQEKQGGSDRYGNMSDAGSDMSDAPQRATAAQLARRKIAAARKTSSARGSRQNTPTATGNPFATDGQHQQQSQMSFQPPPESAGFGGFNFAPTGGAAANPFTIANAAAPASATIDFGANNASQLNGARSGSPFTFGQQATQSPQPQQNGFTNGPFSFGQSSQSQPQQNGFTPSTATTASFPSFGQPNGETPSQGFGQTQSTPQTSFGGLFQNSQEQKSDKPKPAFTFGQTNNHTQVNGDKPAFGAAPQIEQSKTPSTSNVFAGFGQQSQQKPDTASKPMFGATSQAEQTPSTSTSNIFGGQANGVKGHGLFGSTPPPPDSTAKAGESIFSSLQSKQPTFTNMFTQSKDETPKPTTSNVFAGFGQPSQQNGEKPSEQTPKPSLFSGLNSQSNGTSSPQPEQTPKTSSNIFGTTFGQQSNTQPQSSAPIFNFGQSQQDTSMTTPGNTPQKPSEKDSTSVQPASEASSQTPATAIKPLFAPSALFGVPAAEPKTSSDENQTPAPGRSLFDRITPADPPATVAKPPTSFTPATSFKPSDMTAAPWLSHTPAAATALAQQPHQASALAPIVSAVKKTTTMDEVIPDSEKQSLKVLNEGVREHLARQDPTADWTTILEYYLKQAAKLRNKPEPKFSASTAVSTFPPTGAPSHGPPPPSPTKTSMSDSTAPKPSAPSNLFAAASQQNKQSSQPSNHFLQQTPKPSAPTSLFQPPQTAPVNKKRPAEEDADQGPATEKRVRTEYPKLPDNASQTAKLFQAALDKPVEQPSAPAKSVETQLKQPEQASGFKLGGFTPSTTGFTPSSTGFTPSSNGFKPITNSDTPSTSGFKPVVPPGMPKFSAPSADPSSFLGAFGAKAKEEEAKAKKKRMDDDYDSDEETEEEWAARDEIEQEKKRKEVKEAAKKGSGFKPSGFKPSGSALRQSVEVDSTSDKEPETPAGQSKSLFSRIGHNPPATEPKQNLFSAQLTPGPTAASTASAFGSKTPGPFGAASAQAANPDLFGFLNKSKENDKAEPEKDQGTGDNTWKPNTPIKFGGSTATESTTPAAPAPTPGTFGNLFGHIKKSTEGHLSVPGTAKPTLGFNFGGQPSSLGTSRASTPGMTTDGEGTSTAGEGEDEEAPLADPQVEDQCGLLEEELAKEDVLYRVDKAKAMKLGEKKDEAGNVSQGWVDRGRGPVYVLQNKDSKKTRVLMKLPPYGKPCMNFNPLKDMRYEVSGKAGKMVQGSFVDHFDERNPGKISKWLIQVGDPKDATGIAEALMAHRPE